MADASPLGRRLERLRESNRRPIERRLFEVTSSRQPGEVILVSHAGKYEAASFVGGSDRPNWIGPRFDTLSAVREVIHAEFATPATGRSWTGHWQALTSSPGSSATGRPAPSASPVSRTLEELREQLRGTQSAIGQLQDKIREAEAAIVAHGEEPTAPSPHHPEIVRISGAATSETPDPAQAANEA